MKRSILGIVALVLIIAILIAGCGGQPSAPSAPPATSKAPAAETKAPVATPAKAEGEYVIGYIADLTGPAANNALGDAEAFRVYMERLNEQGGINGRPVKVLFNDDRSEGTRSAAAATELVGKNVLLLAHCSMSSTYEASVPVAKKAGIPWVAAMVPHRSSLPPTPDPLVFSNRSMGSTLVGVKFLHYMVKTLSDKAGVPAKLAAGDVDTPEGALMQKDYEPKFDKELGVNTVTSFLIPLNTSNFGPLAARIIDSGANWFTGYTPTFLHRGLFTELKSRGWKGTYLTDAGSGWEELLQEFGSSQFIALSDHSLTMENLPVHQEIQAAAQKYKGGFKTNHYAYGWAMGIWVENALRKVGWPATPDKLRQVMETMGEVKLNGIMYPLNWTATDHHGPTAYRVYGWDESKKAVIALSNWYSISPSDLVQKDIGTSLPR